MDKTAMTPEAATAAGITLADVFRRSARIFADRVAVADETHGTLTYAQLDERANRVANTLVSWGLRRGDRLAVLSEPQPGYVETYVAAAKLGVTVVALNMRMHPSELEQCVKGAEPRVLLHSAAQAEAARALAAVGGIEHVMCFDDPGPGGYFEITGRAAPDAPAVLVDPEDIHNIIYTSGTTGPSKGAMISQRAAATRAMRIVECFGLGPDDGFVGWLPLYHCAGDESLYATLLSGGKFATVGKAEPERMFRAIDRGRLTWAVLIPGLVTDFLDHPQRSGYDLSSLRSVMASGNLMPEAVQPVTAALGVDFYDIFGQTESSYLVAVGRISPGEVPSLRKTPRPLLDVRLVDDDLHEVPVGVPGECVVRGPSVMSGYLDDPEATAEVFRGGWLHTGDVLVRNDDGTLTYTDRKKYLIKTGGENVYPVEVEQVIGAHPAVQEVCVFGVPDERWGETVKAVVVVRSGHALTGVEVAAWCRSRLAGYKRPHYVEFLRTEGIPRNATGKVLRNELAGRPVTAEQQV